MHVHALFYIHNRFIFSIVNTMRISQMNNIWEEKMWIPSRLMMKQYNYFHRTMKTLVRKILGAKFHPWANFPYFFPKKDSPISIISKNYSLKFYRIKLFYLKIAQILLKLCKILRNLNIFTKISPNIYSWHMKD